MKILATQRSESVVCELPDGHQIEITQLVVSGEDVAIETDVGDAVKLLEQHLKLLEALNS